MRVDFSIMSQTKSMMIISFNDTSSHMMGNLQETYGQK